MSTPVNDGNAPSVEDLRAEIVQTRQALGETVKALAEKADVKTRASAFARDTGERARVSAREHRTLLVAVGIGALAVVAAIIVWQRRSSTDRWY